MGRASNQHLTAGDLIGRCAAVFRVRSICRAAGSPTVLVPSRDEDRRTKPSRAPSLRPSTFLPGHTRSRAPGGHLRALGGTAPAHLPSAAAGSAAWLLRRAALER